MPGGAGDFQGPRRGQALAVGVGGVEGRGAQQPGQRPAKLLVGRLSGPHVRDGRLARGARRAEKHRRLPRPTLGEEHGRQRFQGAHEHYRLAGQRDRRHARGQQLRGAAKLPLLACPLPEYEQRPAGTALVAEPAQGR